MGKKVDDASDSKLSKKDREELITRLSKQMKQAAAMLEFEQAAYLRDRIAKLKEGKQ